MRTIFMNDWLNRDIIKSGLSQVAADHIQHIELQQALASTNDYLLEHPAHGVICLAEQQTAGRGRRGKQWHSSRGCQLNYSLCWQFNDNASALAGLSLVIGIAVIAALKQLGCDSAQLKWPNDVYYQQQKLAGILLDVRTDSQQACQVVSGIGINVRSPATDKSLAIDQPWIDLESITGSAISRNQLSSEVTNQLVLHLLAFEQEGLAGFIDEWQAVDALNQQQVTIEQAGQLLTGIACGIDSQGALLVEVNGLIQAFHSGEVSVRRRAEAG